MTGWAALPGAVPHCCTCLHAARRTQTCVAAPPVCARRVGKTSYVVPQLADPPHVHSASQPSSNPSAAVAAPADATSARAASAGPQGEAACSVALHSVSYRRESRFEIILSTVPATAHLPAAPHADGEVAHADLLAALARARQADWSALNAALEALLL